MNSECAAVSLDLFSWLITSFTELGEPCCFDASEVEYSAHLMEKMVENPAQSMGLRCPLSENQGSDHGMFQRN